MHSKFRANNSSTFCSSLSLENEFIASHLSWSLLLSTAVLCRRWSGADCELWKCISFSVATSPHFPLGLVDHVPTKFVLMLVRCSTPVRFEIFCAHDATSLVFFTQRFFILFSPTLDVAEYWHEYDLFWKNVQVPLHWRNHRSTSRGHWWN